MVHANNVEAVRTFMATCELKDWCSFNNVAYKIQVQTRKMSLSVRWPVFHERFRQYVLDFRSTINELEYYSVNRYIPQGVSKLVQLGCQAPSTVYL